MAKPTRTEGTDLLAKHACALGVAVVVILAAIAVSCAPRRVAQLSLYGADTGAEPSGDASTAAPIDARMERMDAMTDDPEALIREQDIARLGELDAIDRAADDRLQRVDRDLYDDISALDVGREDGLGHGRGGFRGALRKAGLVTYVVFASIVTLGMRALPFLV